MSATWVIAGRELREKKRIFFTAAALAVLPFLAALLPAARGEQRITIALVSGFLSSAVAVGVSLILGGTTVGRELSDGRLSFYFSKPVPTRAIWWGKLVASLVAALGSFAIIAVPAIVATGTIWRSSWTTTPLRYFAWIALASAVAFLVTHTVSTMIRSRSALFAADFALLVAAAATVYFLVRPLYIAGAMTLLRWMVVSLAAAALLVLSVGPLWQLERGRTDRRRSHAELSRFVWTALGAVLIVAASYVWWVTNPSPDDLVEPDITPAPAGGWAFVSGQSRGRADWVASFLVAPDGEFVRVPPLWWGSSFSRDGKHAAWAQPVGFKYGDTFEIHRLDFRTRDVIPTGITARRHEMVLSDDGSQLAIAEASGTVSIYDVASNTMLVAARTKLKGSTSMFFPRTGLLRVYDSSTTELRIFELDASTRKLALVGRAPGRFSHPLRTSQDGSRLLLLMMPRPNEVRPARGSHRRAPAVTTLIVADGRSGAILGRYESGRLGSAMLRDGTVVRPVPGSPMKIVIERTTPLEVPLPGVRFALVRGEIAPGKVLVSGLAAAPAADPRRWSQFVIDLNRDGAIERVDQGLQGPFATWPGVDPRPGLLPTGEPLLMAGAGGKLVRWNPLTGERKPGLK